MRKDMADQDQRKNELDKIINQMKEIAEGSGLYYKEVKYAIREHVLQMYKNKEINKDDWKYLAKMIDKEL